MKFLDLKLYFFEKLLESTEETSDNGPRRTNPRRNNPAPTMRRDDDGSGGKSWVLRLFAVAIVVAAVYFLFGLGNPKHLFLKKISGSGGSLKLHDSDSKEHEIDSFDSRDRYSTYAEVVSNTFNEVVYRINTLTKNKSRISFNVSKFKGCKDSYRIRIPSGCSYGMCGKCEEKTECSCDCKDSNCCCEGGKDGCCCKDCCNGASDGKCGCCMFVKLVNEAILNTSDGPKITATSVFFSTLPTILFLTFFMFIIRSVARGKNMGMFGDNSIFKMGQSLSKTVKSNVTFDDVAGIAEVKEELMELVDYLKYPAKYNSMGARTPKGVILYGPPGTGKTLLAKAVSGEASVPFMEVSGSSFDDMFVGSGAKRVRDLFAKARKVAPCIIFIDEIDAVAGKRGSRNIVGGGGNLGDQTINQLLSEMDGFNTQTGIVIIAATNKLDSIDEAILRPGRFDRHIQVSLPDILEREQILRVHARNKNLSVRIDLNDVARKTPGFSGAQLENVLNEATLLSVRNNKKTIGEDDVNEAIDRVIAGPSRKNKVISFNEKKMLAYHESGHAIAGLYAEGGNVVEKITIIPRGKAAGYVMSAPEKMESFVVRRDEMMSQVVTNLAGRAAEEIFYGEDKVSAGASNDLYKTTIMVRDMITKLGMSNKLGLMQYEPSEGAINPYRSDYSDMTAREIDDEMNRIINEQYEKAKSIILQHEDEFMLIVEALLLMETIDRKQIDFIHRNKRLPEAAVEAKRKLSDEQKKLMYD